jgi:phosphatidylinositol N-acetylglucosaminyltransferase subunit P
MSSAQRQKQFYGFTAALATYLLYALYVAWALLPDNLIKAAGITWYPNR